MFKQTIITFLLLASSATVMGRQNGKKGRRSSSSSSSSDDEPTTLTLHITNLSVRQPFAPFFVMTHNKRIDPLFEFGSPSTEELAMLAETGSPAGLVGLYSKMKGVGDAFGFDEGFPYFGGDSLAIEVEVSEAYPYVTIAAMAIHTNDCFVAINGMKLAKGDVVYLPGLDSGSEENNENCGSIPGPACSDVEGNTADGNGEGFVHVHPGFFGIGSLADGRYDWRNPMAQVKVM